MQRSFLVPVVLALLAAGAYFEREPLLGLWRQGYDRVSKAAGGGATPAPAVSDNGAGAPGMPGAPLAPRNAPPGTFYMLVRAKVTSSTGVKAVNPGEQVKLLERLSNKRLRVTAGGADFVVTQSQVTDDGQAAADAERRFRAAPSSL